MKLTRLACLCVLISSSAIAEDVKIVGNIKQTIKIPGTTRGLSTYKIDKEISLLKIELSAHARQQLNRRVANTLKQGPQLLNNKTGVSSVQLGMSNVPVLDQGGYGTCVTFANTAAMDAVLNKGDYVSQLCSLQLGRYLENDAYTVSGWDGSWGGIVLNQLKLFGIVSKSQQKANGCGGLKEYPRGDFNPGTEMTVVEYHQISEPLDQNLVTWSSVFDVYQAMDDKIDMEDALNAVKAALVAGDRITFGVLLPDAEKGTVGAVGKFHAANDSWILTPEIAADIGSLNDLPGHEMIITGYDDAAIAVDAQGRQYTGLFTLRNSWGKSAGDQGDFYLSYDYFKALVIEAQRIRHFSLGGK